ncbi:serine/threonine protein phosphatase [Tersicoccus sp. Bi-70]|uniref:serine/threonine protein phosphatase n=1 Tax=Tersicoccus sp. Bi-70 TaxID=1897634 RepID=UPI000975FDD5|nr:serine/threonine protein phosphatase [Tersicoccus sp. Bi-70]OMH34257.1 serine/threonine protein phosphatase [Tersicoccus sp. Bi-70]
MAAMPEENTFDHRRGDDGEHVGYLHVTDDGSFVPYDPLRRRRAEPMELDDAEALLDRIGLRLLDRGWWLVDPDGSRLKVRVTELRRTSVTVAPVLDDLSGATAKTIDLTATLTLPLPTDRLVEAD